jgi:MEMO1 family protein
MRREPIVAGQFYSSSPEDLYQELQQLVATSTVRQKVMGIIAPHAGYIYSGRTAGAVYGAIEIPDTVLVLGPNHHGHGAPVALFPSGSWYTPLGCVPINERLSDLIFEHSSLVTTDSNAHRFEHSLEVQIPFLQYVNPEVSIVPLCLSIMDYASCETLGKSLAASIRAYGDDVLMVASSDMSHYEPAAVAHHKDHQALDAVIALNPFGLYSIVRSKSITMCGVIPTVVMLVAALELGATSSVLLRYATSGDISGDLSQVVGYAAVSVS